MLMANVWLWGTLWRGRGSPWALQKHVTIEQGYQQD